MQVIDALTSVRGVDNHYVSLSILRAFRKVSFSAKRSRRLFAMQSSLYRFLTNFKLSLPFGLGAPLALIAGVYSHQVREVFGQNIPTETVPWLVAAFFAVLALRYFLLWKLKPAEALITEVERSKASRQQSPRPQAFEQSKPKPDTSLKSVRNRVIAHLGGVPHSGAASMTKQQKAEREEFHKKVDLEILDQVSHHRMNVWGRYGDGARQRLTRFERMRFDHRNDAVSIQGDALRAMVFKDIMFDGEEVKAVWPSKTSSS